LYVITQIKNRGKTRVLNKEEEEEVFIRYVKKMQGIEHPITFTQLKLKITQIKQERSTPFKNMILGWGWVRWLKKCHFDMSLKVVYGLEVGSTKGLCLTNV
jgi:hypothetical protein